MKDKLILSLLLVGILVGTLGLYKLAYYQRVLTPATLSHDHRLDLLESRLNIIERRSARLVVWTDVFSICVDTIAKTDILTGLQDCIGKAKGLP